MLKSLVSLSDTSATGDINIDVAVEQILLQEQTAKRKNWSSLGKYQLPNPPYSVQTFGQMLTVGMAETFGNREPIEFVGLVDIAQVHGQTVHRFTSHHEELIDALCNRGERIIREMMEPDYNKEEAKARGLSEIAAIMGDFHVSGSLDFSQRLNCLKLRCNPRSKTLSITPFKARSTRAEDYPGKFETTSELLEYVAAIVNSGPIISIGDPFWIPRYSWVKFLTSFLDNRSIELGRIQINVDDPEEWDFINTEFDYEIESMKRKT
jgi:hypothetical protein